jgi:hypothetical protein
MKKVLFLAIMLLTVIITLTACGNANQQVDVLGKWSVDDGQGERIYEPAGSIFEFKPDGTFSYQEPDDTEAIILYYEPYDADLYIICEVGPCSLEIAAGYAHMEIQEDHLIMIAFDERINLTRIP